MKIMKYTFDVSEILIFHCKKTELVVSTRFKVLSAS